MLFFTKIGSFLSLIIQIILVVAAVLLFSFFDPFGIFKPSEPKLEDTPVSLRSIKDIGQLISAEYYGEVIVSLKGKYIKEIDTTAASFAEKANTLNQDFQLAVEAMKEQDTVKFRGLFGKKRKMKEYFHAAFPALTSDPNYLAFIEALLAKLHEPNEETLLKRLYKDRVSPGELKVGPNVFEDFKKKELTEIFGDNFKKNRQLVLLGRGWVKAGFDFGDFNQSNFRYDSRSKTIHFIGLEPKLLSCTINPWFIPEKGVKGFEIVLSSSKNSPENMLEAKQEALKMLRIQALERNILQQARENARESLRNFFSLILETQINDVVFHTNELQYNLSIILADDTVQAGELSLVDSLIIRNQHQNREATMKFIAELKTKSLQYFENTYPFRNEVFAINAYQIAGDGNFTAADSILLQEQLSHVDEFTLRDSLWYQLGEKEYKVLQLDSIRKDKCKGLQKLLGRVKLNVSGDPKAAQFPNEPYCP